MMDDSLVLFGSELLPWLNLDDLAILYGLNTRWKALLTPCHPDSVDHMSLGIELDPNKS